MTLPIINQRLSLDEFRAYVKAYNFGTLPANKIVVHHTWRPTKEQWGGQRSILGLKSYYEGKGWPAGPHLFVAEDGIWLFSPMRQNGIHAGNLNDRSIGIEVVGDYDQQVWSGQTKNNALGVINSLKERLGVTNDRIYFHRDVSSKSCPGHAITKEWLFKELEVNRFSAVNPVPTPAQQAVQSVSAPVPKEAPVKPEIMIPVWAAEAVAFVNKHHLFEIQTEEDVRDAVKFYRFYHLIKDQNGAQ